MVESTERGVGVVVILAVANVVHCIVLDQSQCYVWLEKCWYNRFT